MKNDSGVKKLNPFHGATIIVSVILVFIMSVIAPEDFIKDEVLSFFGFFTRKSDFLTIFVENIGQEKGFIATVIWTMTTILFGFLIMYYQMMGTRNFGLTNRRIISYTCGTFFIPIMVAINTVVVCLMTVAFYFDADTDFYLLAVYSFALQGMMIFYCVYPTSYRKTQKTIVKQEREHFYRFYGKNFERSVQGETPTIFMESILYGDELIEEKMEMVSEILRHPFELVYFNRERIAVTVYEYYYLNFTVLAVYLAGHPEDTDRFYKMLYQEIAQWTKYFTYHSDFNKIWKDTEYKKKTRKDSYLFNRGFDKYPMSYQIYKLKKWREFEKCLKASSLESADDYLDEIYFTKMFSCLAAFFQVFLSQKNIKNRWLAITYIINHLVHEEIRPWIQSELFLCIQFLVLTDQLDLSGEGVSAEFEDGMFRLEGCQLIEKNIREILENMKKFRTMVIRCFPELLLPWIGNLADSLENRYEILYRLKDSFKNGKMDIFIYYLRRLEQTNDKTL